jgi:hypothetical protein
LVQGEANDGQAQRTPEEEGDYMAFEQLVAEAAIKKEKEEKKKSMDKEKHKDKKEKHKDATSSDGASSAKGHADAPKTEKASS